MTIEETHQQYDHDLNKRKKKKKIHLISRVRFEYGINFIRISILIFTNIYITYLKI